MQYYTLRLPKIPIFLVLASLVLSLFLAVSLTIANAGVLEDQLASESAATLAQAVSDDYSDIYQMSNEAQGAHGDIMNASVLLRSGKVPGTDLALSDAQKTELITTIKKGLAKAQAREKDTLRAARMTQAQVDLIASVNPAIAAPKLLRREIQATANAAATQTSIDATATAVLWTPTPLP